MGCSIYDRSSKMSANLKFDRKTVLITGAAGHIGRKFCEDFSTLGGRCILVDKDRKILDDIVESLKPVEEGDHFAIEADLGDVAIRKECCTDLYSTMLN